MMQLTDTERAADALHHLDAGCDREKWVRKIMAAKAAELPYSTVHNWSASADNYRDEKDFRAVWNSISENGGIGAGSLFALAKQSGWQDDRKRTASPRPALTIAKPAASPAKPVKHAAYASAVDVWSRCIPATLAEAYIQRKQGKADGLCVYPASASPLVIRGQNVAGYLAVPCWDGDKLQTLQFIPPDGGDKLNLPGASFGDGCFTVGEITDRVYIVEGIGQAWAVNQATGAAAVCCFGAGRMARVAKVLREKYPAARLVIVPDRGKEIQAAAIAANVSGHWVALPDDKSANYDCNEYLQDHGTGALADLLERAKEPPISYPLSVIFADELPDTCTPPDEIVEGVITAGDGSVFYGDTNTGKTYCAVDMACAVARGVPWMGRRTEPGLVLYLAAESPASVRSRLQAYQRHHGVKVLNFAIVQSPIDLFDGDADTEKIIKLVKQIEQQRGQPARLIIGDTLARLSAGANENAGQDMGQVVRRFDRIRTECKAHFMLVHHSGKNAAAGARGWSGVRAAVDTEIEVTDTVSGRCLEITKQRDLSTKGNRIGFRLDVVELGLTKWGTPATSCVVMPADAPMKQTSKRVSEVGGAVMEYLRTQTLGIKKRELVEHFADSYTKSAVYREIKKLVEAGQLSDCAGNIATLAQVRNDAKWC